MRAGSFKVFSRQVFHAMPSALPGKHRADVSAITHRPVKPWNEELPVPWKFFNPSPCHFMRGRVATCSAAPSARSRGPMDRTMASEAVGPGSIPGGTTTLQMQGKPYKIRDFFRFRISPRSCPSRTQRHKMASKHFKICYLMLPKRKQFALIFKLGRNIEMECLRSSRPLHGRWLDDDRTHDKNDS